MSKEGNHFNWSTDSWEQTSQAWYWAEEFDRLNGTGLQHMAVSQKDWFSTGHDLLAQHLTFVQKRCQAQFELFTRLMAFPNGPEMGRLTSEFMGNALTDYQEYGSEAAGQMLCGLSGCVETNEHTAQECARAFKELSERDKDNLHPGEHSYEKPKRTARVKKTQEISKTVAAKKDEDVSPITKAPMQKQVSTKPAPRKASIAVKDENTIAVDVSSTPEAATEVTAASVSSNVKRPRRTASTAAKAKTAGGRRARQTPA
ncbi:hypothetical protein [Polycladidibacter stylochi]|uniref:hypothetical protein n=1 Tax=Polycladidibacter stylochi TaxID=1807766 RepID=UPI000832D470|nr:hypothetical protein [Pseudovibrio stylochi]